MQVPSLVTTTFVGYVESKASLALRQLDITYVHSEPRIVLLLSVYLLYMRMSGFQRLLGGTLMSFTLLYSVVFHLMFESVHSCDIPALSFSVSALEMTGLIDIVSATNDRNHRVYSGHSGGNQSGN